MTAAKQTLLTIHFNPEQHACKQAAENMTMPCSLSAGGMDSLAHVIVLSSGTITLDGKEYTPDHPDYHQVAIEVHRAVVNGFRHYGNVQSLSPLVTSFTRSKPETVSAKYASALENAGVFLDANSALRNSAMLAAGYAPHAAPALVGIWAGCALSAGVVITALGTKLAADAAQETARAYRNGDSEGVVHAGSRSVALGAFAALGPAVLTSVLASPNAVAKALKVPANGAVAAKIGVAIPALMGVMFGGLLIHAGYVLSYLSSFRAKMNKANQNQTLYEFLAQQLQLSDQDKELPPADQQKRYEALRSALVRRVGESTVELLESILARKEMSVQVPESDRKRVTAMALEHNYKLIVKSLLLLLIAIVGVTVTVLSFVSTGGVATMLLILLAFLWLTVDSSRLHQSIADSLWHRFGRPASPTSAG
jgi:hypothetical protein